MPHTSVHQAVLAALRQRGTLTANEIIDAVIQSGWKPLISGDANAPYVRRMIFCCGIYYGVLHGTIEEAGGRYKAVSADETREGT